MQSALDKAYDLNELLASMILNEVGDVQLLRRAKVHAQEALILLEKHEDTVTA